MNVGHQYVYIENGIIIEGPKKLPEEWKNISGMSGFTSNELKSMNWVLVSGFEKPQYNSIFQEIIGPNIEVSGTEGNYVAEASWTVEFKSASHILSVINSQIDEMREEMIARGAIIDLGDSNGPFTVQTRGEHDSRNITGLAGVATTSLLLGQPLSVDFRDQDDVVHNLNAQQILSMQAQIATWIQSHYYVAWAHKANIKVLYDENDLQGMIDYDITQGWPG